MIVSGTHEDEQGQIIARWVGFRLGIEMQPPYCAVASLENASFVAGAVLNNYSGCNVDISVYGPQRIRRAAIRAVFRHAFDVLRVERVTALTRPSNAKARAFLDRLGFDLEGMSARFFGPDADDTALRYVLFRKHAQRWMN